MTLTGRKVFLAFAALFASASLAHGMTANQLIHGGGPIGYTTILCSILGLAIAIEHFVSIRIEKLAPVGLLEDLEKHLAAGDYEAAMQTCEGTESFVSDVVAAALPKMQHGFESMETAADDRAGELGIKMHMRVAWISLVAAIAPMLGLLGTVWGMVGAFETISASTAPEPKDFAEDIALALITTVQGLVVAIPMMSLFFACRARVTRILLELDTVVDGLLDRFRHMK